MGAPAQERPRLLKTCAVVLAAGRGRRMGADKALLDLEGETALARIRATCAAAGIDAVVVVRARGAASLPAGLGVEVATVEPDVEMIDSLRAGVAAAPEAELLLVWPVDLPLVAAATVVALVAAFDPRGPGVALPIHGGRPGHPVVMSAAQAARATAPEVHSLRDVIRSGPVQPVPVMDPWVLRDLDTSADLEAARDLLRQRHGATLAVMRAHRSRRGFHPDPIPEEVLVELVDAARYASTSSFIQAYAVVAVRDPARKADVARLCADYEHVRQAPVFLAICADLTKLAASCRRHGAALDSSSFDLFVQATIDAALLGQNLLLAAESLGFGGCMIGAARNEPVELARLLNLPPLAFVPFGLVLGRPADDPLPRGRMPLSGVLFFERYDPSVADAVLDAADAAMRLWARAANRRASPAARPVDESKGWSDRMARIAGRSGTRDALRARLRDLGFTFEG